MRLARTATASRPWRPGATLVRLPAAENAAGRPLRFAIRKTVAPASIARGDTTHPPRVIVTLTFASVRVPDAVRESPANGRIPAAGVAAKSRSAAAAASATR